MRGREKKGGVGGGRGWDFRLIRCEYFTSDEAFFLKRGLLEEKNGEKSELNMNKDNAINRPGQKKVE